ncbi:MAG: glycosyltransferase [Rhodocyclaceae bacterium]|nr:glycosyltransferase [Rhodocyclaceae bacterium]
MLLHSHILSQRPNRSIHVSPEFDASLPRVLHVGKFFPPERGGIEIYLADLVRAQRSAGQAAFALVHGTPRSDDPRWLRRVPAPVTLIFAPIAPAFPFRLARAIRDFEPDVLHLHVPNLSALWVLAIPAARAIPWVVHWHADVVQSRIQKGLALAYRLYRPFERALLERADRIIATSQTYLDASEPLAPWRHKCSTVALGIDLERLPRITGTERIGCADEGPFRIASIGRLTYYKGFETLIDAVASCPGIELDIIGEGEERATLEARISRLPPQDAGRIRLRGAVGEAEKFEFLRRCDLFCLASRERTEAFGIAILEAMGMGRPCLVTDLPGSGMPWLVSSAGAGRLARLDDPGDWREQITRLASNRAECRRLGEAGRQALEAQFSMDRSVRHLLDLYPRLHKRPSSDESRILIVIPARDEEDTIGTVVSRLHASGWHDIVVVNDHSRDGTAARARECGAIVIEPVLPLGAWGAMQTGIRFALRHGYGGVITMDADGQHEAAELPNLMRSRHQANVVIGAFPERGSKLRRLAWIWFQRLSGFSFADLTSGFRYYDSKALTVLAAPEATLLDYQDIGVLLLLRAHHLSIVEIPVSMNMRQSGKSRIFSSWFAVAHYMVKTTLLCIAGRRRTQLADVT